MFSAHTHIQITIYVPLHKNIKYFQIIHALFNFQILYYILKNNYITFSHTFNGFTTSKKEEARTRKYFNNS